MANNLTNITRGMLATIFRLGAPIVHEGVYYRPANPPTPELTAPCQFVCGQVFSTTFLGLAAVSPGTEMVIVRASELTTITDPYAGDFIIENMTNLRRDIHAARLDVSCEFYTLQTMRV